MSVRLAVTGTDCGEVGVSSAECVGRNAATRDDGS